MQNKKLRVIVVTPEGEIYNDYADYVNAWSPLGSFRILYNHAPMVSFLISKKIEVGTTNKKVIIEASSGILEVLNNEVKIALERASSVEG